MIDFHESRSHPETSETSESIAAVAATLAREIDALFSRFRLDEEEAGELLREILLLAIYRWDQIANHEIWLLATLRRACVRRLLRQTSPEA